MIDATVRTVAAMLYAEGYLEEYEYLTRFSPKNEITGKLEAFADRCLSRAINAEEAISMAVPRRPADRED